MLTLWLFLQNESDATSIEYSLIAAGIALVIVAVVQSLGTTFNSKFTTVSNSVR